MHTAYTSGGNGVVKDGWHEAATWLSGTEGLKKIDSAVSQRQ